MAVSVLRMPGLDVKLAGDLQLEASGSLAPVCAPFLKKINARLREEKPAAVYQDRVIASTWLPPIPGKVFTRLLRAEVSIALGRYVPETVSFEITRKCMCKCEHCVVSGGEDELSLGEIKRAIDQALDMGAIIITFTEGDPLLREDVYELVRYVDKDRAIVNVFTPGTELTPQAADELRDAGLHNLLVSIYSADPGKHDAVRRLEGAHAKAVNAIRLGLDAGLLVTMATHISPDRMEELPSLYELASRLGVHEFSIWESVPKKPGDMILSDADRKAILEMQRQVNSTPGGPRIFSNTYFEGEMLGCMAGRRWMHVCVGGDVKPCPYMPFGFGNIRESPLKKIWRKMRGNKVLRGEHYGCMMHSGDFLEYVSRIPDGARLPYEFALVE